MAEITVKGYVNKPSARKGSKGDFSTFTLSEKQKERDGTTKRVFYNVYNFKATTAPEEGSYVTLKGYLNVRDYEKDGVKRQSLDIVANEVEVSPPRDGSSGTTKAPDPSNVDDWAF